MSLQEPSSVSVLPSGSEGCASDPLRAVVSVRGVHDVATTGVLSRAIERAAALGDTDVVVDLSDITFMDASTVTVLVEAHNLLLADDRALWVRDPSPLARRILLVCGLAFLIDGEPAVGSALKSWVAVPASERATAPTQAPVAEPADRGETAHPSVSRSGERVGTFQPRRTTT